MIIEVRLNTVSFTSLIKYLESPSNILHGEVAISASVKVVNGHITTIKEVKGVRDELPCGSFDVTLEIVEKCVAEKSETQVNLKSVIDLLKTFEKFKK